MDWSNRWGRVRAAGWVYSHELRGWRDQEANPTWCPNQHLLFDHIVNGTPLERWQPGDPRSPSQVNRTAHLRADELRWMRRDGAMPMWNSSPAARARRVVRAIEDLGTAVKQGITRDWQPNAWEA